MIEIKARLMRAESAMYAAGEKVECLIEFNHTSNDDGHHENLAWASVQLHCYRKTTMDKKSETAVAELTESFNKTALDSVIQNTGEIIIATKPKILFCDLKLEPGDSKSYFYTEIIPRDGPPTYRGHDIRYFYRLTIATQRVKSKVQSLTVPIRVLPIPIIVKPEDFPGNDTTEELTPTNPFLEKREITELEISWHHLKNVTARRLPKFYRITNKRGYVGRFCLFKAAYKLGEDIVGSLDFSNCEVRCVQFSVKLQSEEILGKNVNTQLVPNSNVETPPLNDGDKSKQQAPTTIEATGKISTYTTYHEVCLSMLQTQMIIPIPLHITPTFETDAVEVRWRLHFEFVTSTLMDYGEPDLNTGEWTAPTEIPVETMIWNLPVTIYTANPLQIYTPSTEFKLTIK